VTLLQHTKNKEKEKRKEKRKTKIGIEKLLGGVVYALLYRPECVLYRMCSL
jgi:hypothetical protein